jgi:hypothetical protein
VVLLADVRVVDVAEDVIGVEVDQEAIVADGQVARHPRRHYPDSVMLVA